MKMINKLISSLSHKNRMRVLSFVGWSLIFIVALPVIIIIILVVHVINTKWQRK